MAALFHVRRPALHTTFSHGVLHTPYTYAFIRFRVRDIPMQIQSLKPYIGWLVTAVVLSVLVAVGWAFQDRWVPLAKTLLIANSPSADGTPNADAHGSASHVPHPGHNELDSLELSEQARRNIGLTADMLRPVALETFTRTLDVPARVVERPGRTHIEVPSPMSGIVTAVYAVQGEAITPRTVLFKVRLTHEDLVQAQADFLKMLGELDVENQQIARLEKLDESGIIAGKTLLTHKFAKQKIEAELNAQREALRLHGLSQEQVNEIERSGTLLGELTVRAPASHSHGTAESRQALAIRPAAATANVDEPPPSVPPPEPQKVFTVRKVNVHRGGLVAAGEPLCVLVDLAELYVEGQGFEQDAEELTRAAREGWAVSVVPEDTHGQAQPVEGLKIAYVDNEVDAQSRALRFYVELPNEIVQSSEGEDGHRFITWRFKPGQRMQLRVPVEQWTKRIVLPVDAVAQEGAEYYVFQQNGDHFDRRSVHVEYQDQYSVVIAGDGSIFPGDVIARAGAHQLQMALKNKAGGGVDPHAGHNH